jgi:hypothetical protein
MLGASHTLEVIGPTTAEACSGKLITLSATSEGLVFWKLMNKTELNLTDSDIIKSDNAVRFASQRDNVVMNWVIVEVVDKEVDIKIHKVKFSDNFTTPDPSNDELFKEILKSISKTYKSNSTEAERVVFNKILFDTKLKLSRGLPTTDVMKTIRAEIKERIVPEDRTKNFFGQAMNAMLSIYPLETFVDAQKYIEVLTLVGDSIK